MYPRILEYKAILEIVPFYTGLDHLSSYNLSKGKIHPLLKVNCQSTSDIMRLPIKLKILTGYILFKPKESECTKKRKILPAYCANQMKRILNILSFTCKKLSDTRDPILLELYNYLSNRNIIFGSLTRHSQLQIIMDATSLKKSKKWKDKYVPIIERCTWRLLFQLHITRAKLLKII